MKRKQSCASIKTFIALAIDGAARPPEIVRAFFIQSFMSHIVIIQGQSGKTHLSTAFSKLFKVAVRYSCHDYLNGRFPVLNADLIIIEEITKEHINAITEKALKEIQGEFTWHLNNPSFIFCYREPLNNIPKNDYISIIETAKFK